MKKEEVKEVLDSLAFRLGSVQYLHFVYLSVASKVKDKRLKASVSTLAGGVEIALEFMGVKPLEASEVDAGRLESDVADVVAGLAEGTERISCFII